MTMFKLKLYPAVGWVLAGVAIAQIPGWCIYTIYRQEVDPWIEVFYLFSLIAQFPY